MKNRTIIGIICMVLAVVLTFAVTPLVSRVKNETVKVPRLSQNVERGSKIQKGSTEIVEVAKDTLPKGVITEENRIVGKFAAADLFAGDFVTESKVKAVLNSAEDVIYSFNGTKFAMSFTIDSFAAGLSGKMRNGDIISLVVKDQSGKTVMPKSFQYVKVITTTTSGGVDQDKIIKNEDGSFDPPATVTLLVNAEQAEQLADFESGTIFCVLVYRGSAENAQQFLDKQDEYFKAKAEEETEGKSDE